MVDRSYRSTVLMTSSLHREHRFPIDIRLFVETV